MWRDDSGAGEDSVAETIAGPAGGSLVLIVEDDSVFRKFVTAVLQRHGFRTVEAPNAESGWMLVRRLRPSMVVLDYALSCAEGATLRSGWDLAERMASDPKTRGVPLLFLTGFEMLVQDRLRTRRFARPPDHLEKPVHPQALIERIHQVLGRNTDQRIVRVLVADDDPTVAAFLGKVLSQDRFHTVMVNNGEECLHLLRTQRASFDLLLLDLMMPDVSGYDVLREMSITGLARDLPVIVLTNEAEGRSEEERRLLRDGIVLEVLAKSTVHGSPQLLPEVIRRCMQYESVASAAAQSSAAEPDEPERRAA
jgi:CheY-like chemotaxis protein